MHLMRIVPIGIGAILSSGAIHKVSTPAELGRVLVGSLRLSKSQNFSNLLKYWHM
nr:MAG TPA_asm: hypothetical protein [Caudoviricetes sp.]